MLIKKKKKAQLRKKTDFKCLHFSQKQITVDIWIPIISKTPTCHSKPSIGDLKTRTTKYTAENFGTQLISNKHTAEAL